MKQNCGICPACQIRFQIQVVLELIERGLISPESGEQKILIIQGSRNDALVFTQSGGRIQKPWSGPDQGSGWVH